MTKKHQETPKPQPQRPQPANQPKPLTEEKGIGSIPRPKK